MLGKRFAYLCAGILCLAIAYQLGPTAARGQEQDQVIAAAFGNLCAITADGRVFLNETVAEGPTTAARPRRRSSR